MKIIFYTISCSILLTFQPLFAQQEGLIAKIENPSSYFQDERQSWTGKTIFFLKKKTEKIKNPYFDWYYNPFNMIGTKPNPDDLAFKYGKFIEVWHGNLHVIKPDRKYVHKGFFWKVQLLHNDRIIYFWDDNESRVSNFGFVDDYEEARSHIGETLWNKTRDNLYKLDDSGGIPLKNLEQVILEDVQWGEFGNFPIKFFLTTKTGKKGYFLEKNFNRFIEDWHTFNPRDKFLNWSYYDWKFIENRRLHGKMNKDMVSLSWGEPTKIDYNYEKGLAFEIWTYEGVKKTTYYLRFLKNKLQHVWWDDKR